MSQVAEEAGVYLSQRGSSAPYLNGGSALQKERLIELLAHIDGSSTAEWIEDDDVLRAAARQVGNLGLIERSESGYKLSELGASWLRAQDDAGLFRILHTGLVYFGELLARLADEGARVEDLLTDATETYHLAWTSRDQVRRRLVWLHALGLVVDGPDRLHLITEEGRRLLEEVDLASPAEVAVLLQSARAAELLATPPLLSEQIAMAEPERRMAIGYIPRDPLAAFCAVVEMAAGGVDRRELTEQLAKRFEISESSANSLIMTARTLRLHHYIGRETIAPTDLGLEFVDNASALNLVRLMHSRHLAFGEALSVLGSSPMGAGDVHRALFAEAAAAPNQSRTTAVLRRLLDADAVAEIGYSKFVLTPVGRALIQELPMAQISPEPKREIPRVGAMSSLTTEVDLLVEELVAASTDIAHPQRLEDATARAFRALGVEARHIGGPGATDVLLTVVSNLSVLGRVIVDSKSSASGQLREDSVVIETLKEHAGKYGADYMVVVAPGYDNAGRLPSRAHANGIVLLTAAQLGQVVRGHQRIPYGPRDVLDLLTVSRESDVVERRQIEEDELGLVARVIGELRSEAQEEAAEAITARDIYRLLRKTATVSEASIADVLEFLAHPRIGAVHKDKQAGFTLPADPRVAALRLRSLAGAVESSASTEVPEGN